ncbi:MAG: T9SS type A sorting domain-containing protein [Chitinophagaceae bacterium]|nr:T9SS type A sorting domain-containing protein [Chitinophagaceae bacterium]
MMKSFTTVILCCLVFAVGAQPVSRKTYMIISSTAAPTVYNHVVAVDMKTGKLTEDIYNTKKRYAYRNSALRPYENREADDRDESKLPLSGSVACMAFDAKNNRLYYVPQLRSELRYIDLKQGQPSFTCFESQSLNLMHNNEDLANQVSRMTIGADGFGYALTNDGEHLIKFSTQETPVIQDLGVLVDNPKNQVLVRSSCTSWGGDLVAGADGNLYLVTVRNHIFRISLPSKQADYVGMIKKLPEGYTSNGASVDEDGNLVVSCGMTTGQNFTPLYKVNWTTLEASALQKVDDVSNVSDMASSNLLFQKDNKQATNTVVAFSATETSEDNLPVISVFPNPVTNRRFQVKVANMKEKGTYKMILMDVNGKAIMEGKMNIGTKTSTTSFSFPAQHARGVYFVHIADAFDRTVYSQQIIIE